ncbi:hypothetical protein C3747_211g339c [Trypanosoma cruzi]|uniref:Uncharacterized protein n=2 Tax=Trypanosoma cruzi TaxID=5693 RepID=Q4CZM7_TRYCC|nr:hypothetical protein, conserved [Trypanosoma cruzi]EAN85731.1 hypothetical protein, conserved [Trypanosoma cruzi]PWU99987.1 hypothetical protein C3747_211g339c [Trypanosoma cruzi]RNC56652.1 hypothetical protein TcCL_ESM05786 [Trypanosoma cruzi]|eukprot:XP_807582.1 hypothetical protein [Trypanosoma cruzi strain CL Brener]
MSGDTYFRRAIDWMYGDTAYLQKMPSPEIGEKHINELLGRHPFHPFDPEMKPDHPCYNANAIFYNCMTADHVEGYELHMKHVSCYFPYKTDLMKCLSGEKRRARAAACQDATEQPNG